MKNLTYIFVAALLFTGCSQKDLASPNNISNSNAIDGDTVSIDESGINEYGISENGLTNGSKDGFESAYFEFGKYNLSPSMVNTIEKNIVVAQQTSTRIKIDGNCDAFGTDEYNYALGLKRANSVKQALLNGGVDSNRIVIVSLGESNPLCQEESENCYRSNRRADLSLIRD